MKSSTSQAATKTSTTRFKFIREIIAELKKVVWLSRREAIYLTILVLIVSATVGLFLGIIDFGFSNLINKVFIGR